MRQAINMSLDRKGMIDALYGEVAEPLNGMMVRKSSFGWNPNLKEYPYDPAKAKQLIQEAGAVGQSLELISRNGVFPRVDEVTELFANQISQTGLKVTVKSLEVGQWRAINAAGQAGRGPQRPPPDQRQRPGAGLVAHADELLRVRRGQRALVRPGVDRQVQQRAGAEWGRPRQGLPGALAGRLRPERVHPAVRPELHPRHLAEAALGPDQAV